MVSPPSVYLEIDLKVENKGDRNSVVNRFDILIAEIGEYKNVRPSIKQSVQTPWAQVMTRYASPASIQRMSPSGVDFVVRPNEVVTILLPFVVPAPASQYLSSSTSGVPSCLATIAFMTQLQGVGVPRLGGELRLARHELTRGVEILDMREEVARLGKVTNEVLVGESAILDRRHEQHSRRLAHRL